MSRAIVPTSTRTAFDGCPQDYLHKTSPSISTQEANNPFSVIPKLVVISPSLVVIQARFYFTPNITSWSENKTRKGIKLMIFQWNFAVIPLESAGLGKGESLEGGRGPVGLTSS